MDNYNSQSFGDLQPITCLLRAAIASVCQACLKKCMSGMPQKAAPVKLPLVVAHWLFVSLLIGSENCSLSLHVYVKGFVNPVTYTICFMVLFRANPIIVLRYKYGNRLAWASLISHKVPIQWVIDIYIRHYHVLK